MGQPKTTMDIIKCTHSIHLDNEYMHFEHHAEWIPAYWIILLE